MPGNGIADLRKVSSTFPNLEDRFPVLQRLARTHRFRLRIVGSGRDELAIPGVDFENLRWDLDREIEDFRRLDIGLYPIRADAWSVGKSGFKAVQYLAVGVPYVVSPVGACEEIGEPGLTHFPASTPDDWYESLALLLSDASRRRSMGEAGRRYALDHFTVAALAETLARVLRDAGST